MKWSILLKAILCVLLGAIWTASTAGEYRDSTLWVEVLVNSGTNLAIKGRLGSAQAYTVKQDDSPMSCELGGDLKISLASSDQVAYWGFLDRVENWDADPLGEDDVVIRKYPVWESGRLRYKRERLVFGSEGFVSREEALLYAKEHGIAPKSVHEIPISNGTVKITQADGQAFYFEAPLRIVTTGDINPGTGAFDYSGTFIVKCVKGKIVLNHFLPLDEYIAGVIQNEIGSNAPPEAMKAQAVAARTHAVSLLAYNRHGNDGYDLCNGTHCQVYKGRHLSSPFVRDAVFETAGEILMYADKAIDATYHSCCGGKTDSSANIWKGNPVPYLMGIACITEADTLDLSVEANSRAWLSQPSQDPGQSSWERAAGNWSRTVPLSTLASNTGAGHISSIRIEKRGRSGRIIRMTIFGDKIVLLDSESSIRKAFGGTPSSFFYIQGKYSESDAGVSSKPGSTMKLVGKGSGHGVGMCQVGALRMARGGYSYQQILSKYYPDTILTTDWMAYE